MVKGFSVVFGLLQRGWWQGWGERGGELGYTIEVELMTLADGQVRMGEEPKVSPHFAGGYRVLCLLKWEGWAKRRLKGGGKPSVLLLLCHD